VIGQAQLIEIEGPQISVEVPEEGPVEVECIGDCKVRKVAGLGFTEGFTAGLWPFITNLSKLIPGM
jgi:hypothetical protein